MGLGVGGAEVSLGLARGPRAERPGLGLDPRLPAFQGPEGLSSARTGVTLLKPWAGWWGRNSPASAGPWASVSVALPAFPAPSLAPGRVGGATHVIRAAGHHHPRVLFLRNSLSSVQQTCACAHSIPTCAGRGTQAQRPPQGAPCLPAPSTHTSRQVWGRTGMVLRLGAQLRALSAFGPL